jgi:hypothetical protein
MKVYKEFETELDALPIALLLEEYRIPYEQDGEKIAIPKNLHKQVDKLLIDEELRQQEWLTFSRYESETLLKNITDLLDYHGILYKTIKFNTAVDEVYMTMNEMATHYTLSLMAKDFPKVNALLKEDARKQNIYKEDDYYLRGLSNQELVEILEEPDQWHIVDVVGAQYLLDERGVTYTDDDVELMRLHKMIQLRRPKTASRSNLLLGYILSIFFGLLGIFMGLYYLNDKTVLPNGRKVLTFDHQSRAHGLQMVKISIFSSTVAIILAFTLNFLSL